MQRLLVAFVAALAVIVTVQLAQSHPETATPHKGNISFAESVTPSNNAQVASDFSWVDKDGKHVSLKDFRGKVVFINFWGTWCRPCRMELPDIISLAHDYSGDVQFIGVAMERPGGDVMKNLVSFTQEQKIPYQIVVGTQDLADAYGGLQGVPTTFIVDKKGNIVGSLVGMRDRATFEQLLKKVL